MVDISFSRGSPEPGIEPSSTLQADSFPYEQQGSPKLLSCVRLFTTHELYSPWNSLGQNTGMGSLSLSFARCAWKLMTISALKESQVIEETDEQSDKVS